MFEVFSDDAAPILRDFGLSAEIVSLVELQRYHYERDDPNSKEVRLIDRVLLADGRSLVIRFKNEVDVSLELVESQSRFADRLRTDGVPCPRQYAAGGAFAKWYTIHGYRVIVTVEEFVQGQLQCVTPEIAKRTGQLLARTHTISEQRGLHVENSVLFDPFTENDLFKFPEFQAIGKELSGDSLALHRKIVQRYKDYMQVLSPLQAQPRYAVQGDLSDCNLYQLEDGSLGIFDFNRCGDNVLYCDAVMQAVFEARLMDYPEDCPAGYEDAILTAFLQGYQAERPFNDRQRGWFPYLYAIIRAFWAIDVVWRGDSLLNAHAKGDANAVHAWLETIWHRLSTLRTDVLPADAPGLFPCRHQ